MDDPSHKQNATIPSRNKYTANQLDNSIQHTEVIAITYLSRTVSSQLAFTTSYSTSLRRYGE